MRRSRSLSRIVHPRQLCSLRSFIVASTCIFVTCIIIISRYFSSDSNTPKLTFDSDIVPDIYHSMDVFRLNYGEMEKNFKVYIYPDGDPNTYYQTPRKITGKYASEGYFFQNIRESRFRTDDPDQAHLFFIPISCHKMRGKGTSYENMTIIVQDYVQSLISKYPHWNRTLGTDHFFVTCHDVGVRATEGVPLLVKNSIRVVCSPSYDVGFIPHKDVPLPQVLQPFALAPGGNDIANRKTLGFWAGHRNSKIRVILAREWENDTELDIQNNRINRATGHLVYQKKFYTTKFCICPGGSQVNSARIADSIHYGCVPELSVCSNHGHLLAPTLSCHRHFFGTPIGLHGAAHRGTCWQQHWASPYGTFPGLVDGGIWSPELVGPWAGYRVIKKKKNIGATTVPCHS